MKHTFSITISNFHYPFPNIFLFYLFSMETIFVPTNGECCSCTPDSKGWKSKRICLIDGSLCPYICQLIQTWYIVPLFPYVGYRLGIQAKYLFCTAETASLSPGENGWFYLLKSKEIPVQQSHKETRFWNRNSIEILLINSLKSLYYVVLLFDLLIDLVPPVLVVRSVLSTQSITSNNYRFLPFLAHCPLIENNCQCTPQFRPPISDVKTTT